MRGNYAEIKEFLLSISRIASISTTLVAVYFRSYSHGSFCEVTAAVAPNRSLAVSAFVLSRYFQFIKVSKLLF